MKTPQERRFEIIVLTSKVVRLLVLIQSLGESDGVFQSNECPEIVAGDVTRDVLIITRSRNRHEMERICRARLLQPRNGFLDKREDPFSECYVSCHTIVLPERPEGLSPAVILSSLRDEVSVGSLPAGKEIEALAGNRVIAGEIIHPNDVRSITQPEGIILELVHVLNVETVHLVAGDQVVDQVCLKRIHHFLFRKGDVDAVGKDLLPIRHRALKILIESG